MRRKALPLGAIVLVMALIASSCSDAGSDPGPTPSQQDLAVSELVFSTVYNILGGYDPGDGLTVSPGLPDPYDSPSQLVGITYTVTADDLALSDEPYDYTVNGEIAVEVASFDDDIIAIRANTTEDITIEVTDGPTYTVSSTGMTLNMKSNGDPVSGSGGFTIDDTTFNMATLVAELIVYLNL